MDVSIGRQLVANPHLIHASRLDAKQLVPLSCWVRILCDEWYDAHVMNTACEDV